MLDNKDINRIRFLVTTKKLNRFDKIKLLEMLIHYACVRARKDFYTYHKLIAPIVLPETYRDGRHIKLLCGLLQRTVESVEGTQKKKVQPMVSLPPGASKSVTCSQSCPSWALGRNPNWYILAVGHTIDFAVDTFGRKTQDIMRSQIYQTVFPEVTLREDVTAAGRWATEQKGTFLCAGAGKSIAGRRGHLIIADDVISEQTAASKDETQKIIDWYPGGLLSRKLPQGAIIHVATRWLPDDLIGFVQKQERKRKFEDRTHVQFSVPALLDERMAEFFKLPVNTSFWPEYWPTHVFEEIRDTSGISVPRWSCLYMQNPIPESGNIIKYEWCQTWEHSEIPPLEFVILSLDTAGTTKKENDSTGYAVTGVFKRLIRGHDGKEYSSSHLLLLKGGEERLNFVGLLKLVDDIYKEYTPDVLLVENAPVALAFIQELERRGYPVVKYRGKGDKVTRMEAASPFFQQGRIWFPDTKWAKTLIGYLAQFPKRQHDDFDDALSQTILWVRDSNLVGSQSYLDDPDEEDGGGPSTGSRGVYSYWSSAK